MGWNRVFKTQFQNKVCKKCGLCNSECIITFLAIIVQNCVKNIVSGIFSPKFFIPSLFPAPKQSNRLIPSFFLNAKENVRKRERERERERKRDGLRASSAEAGVRSAEGGQGNTVAKLLHSWRHSLPTRLVTGLPFYSLLFLTSLSINIILILLITPFHTSQHNQNKVKLICCCVITGQGVLVSTSDEGAPLLLDDGTGVIHLSLSGDFRLRPWKTGMYVMVVGGYIASLGEPPMIKVQNKTLHCSFMCQIDIDEYCWTLD